MGKKITIDSATMMNKIFEVIEASKIFDLNINKFEILIHPRSYIHAIVHFKNGLTKFLAHDTTMEIPITNAILNSLSAFCLLAGYIAIKKRKREQHLKFMLSALTFSLLFLIS